MLKHKTEGNFHAADRRQQNLFEPAARIRLDHRRLYLPNRRARFLYANALAFQLLLRYVLPHHLSAPAFHERWF